MNKTHILRIILAIFITLFVSKVWSKPTQELKSSKCQAVFGKIKLVSDGEGCHVKTQKSTDPILIKWPFSTNGFTHKDLISLTAQFSSMENIQGVEFRLFESDDINSFISYKMTLFAKETFNLLQSKVANNITISLTHFKSEKPYQKKYKALGMYIQLKTPEVVSIDLKSFQVAKKTFEQGFVSVTFDDGYESVKEARNILKVLPATAYIIREGLGKKGYITSAEACTLARQGWSVSSHATPPFTEVPNLESFVSTDFKAMKQDCESLFRPEHLAYPLGEYNADVLSVVKKYYKSARLAGAGLETLPPADMYKLRAVNVTPDISPAELLKMAQSSIDNGDWLILMFHYLTPKKDSLQPLEYSTENFNVLARGLEHHKGQVLTVPQVMDKLNKR